ncbi:MAG TPA: tetratricopeptide repeat protein [Terriglobia bacterium]|nr:tetratricopeptide repeat protein [Terriglobia bacterium]
MAFEEQHQYALYLFEQGFFEDAVRLMAEVVREEESGERWNDWASAQVRCGRYAEAERGYRRALELGDLVGRTLANLAVLLVQTQQYAPAIPLLERALENATEQDAGPLAKLLTLCHHRQPKSY